jgi:hypothetical protein
MTKQEGLKKLALSEGMDQMDMLEKASFNGIKDSGCMGTRFDNPAEMGQWIADNIKVGQEIVVQLYV